MGYQNPSGHSNWVPGSAGVEEILQTYLEVHGAY